MADRKPCLALQRQHLILLRLRRNCAVRIGELTSLLRVSEMTVRRDLGKLARGGVVAKVHGGAVLQGTPNSRDRGSNPEPSPETSSEASIARVAAELVKPGSAIALSAGTATYSLACQLQSTPGLTAVTNSLRIADVLTSDIGAPRTVVLTGGTRAPSGALVGPIAERAIRSLHVDTVFLGCHGMHPDAGLTAADLAEAETNRQFIRAAHRLVVVADHTKWGTVGLSRFADMRDIDVLICDTGLDPEARNLAADLAGELVLARQRRDTATCR